MNRFVLLTILALAAIVGCTLAFADDAQAGHGRRGAGCGAAASGCAGAHGAYQGWYPLKHLLGFERRQARREARHARRAARYDYGCAGAPAASCSGHYESDCGGDYLPEPTQPTSHEAPDLSACPDVACPE